MATPRKQPARQPREAKGAEWERRYKTLRSKSLAMTGWVMGYHAALGETVPEQIEAFHNELIAEASA